MAINARPCSRNDAGLRGNHGKILHRFALFLRKRQRGCLCRPCTGKGFDVPYAFQGVSWRKHPPIPGGAGFGL